MSLTRTIRRNIIKNIITRKNRRTPNKKLNSAWKYVKAKDKEKEGASQ